MAPDDSIPAETHDEGERAGEAAREASDREAIGRQAFDREAFLENRLRFPDLRKVPPTLDVDDLDDKDAEAITDEDVKTLLNAKVAGATHFYVGLTTLDRHVTVAGDLLPAVRPLPRQVKGVLHQPDGSPATRVGVQPAAPTGAALGKAVLTDSTGLFTLPLGTVDDATRQAVLDTGLVLRLTGSDGSTAVTVQLPPLGGEALGIVVADRALAPLEGSVVGALIDIVEGLENLADTTAPPPGREVAQVRLGEDACAMTFSEDRVLRRFPYRVLVRLVEPMTTTTTRAQVFGRHLQPLWTKGLSAKLGLRTRMVQRVPVDKPISVDGFRDKLIGDVGGIIGTGRDVPMAGTLGLGYVINMAQVWTNGGHSLGNLLYSLPLAPGEQQRIAVSERTSTASVRETEFLDVAEAASARTRQDASTTAVFESAFRETVRAGSTYENEASSSSWGVAGGIGGILAGPIGAIVGGVGASGGGGSSSNSGSTTSALDGARTFTSNASEQLHNSVVRESAARRSAQRTAIRLATTTDTEQVTTKVITNHNRTRALTVQYWEVLRHFRVTDAVEGVTLTCFVPLDLVRFLPPGQLTQLRDDALIGAVGSREALLDRYRLLHRNADAIQPWLPSRHREGLRILEDFVANPRASVDLGAPASDVLEVRVTGSFLTIDDVWVTVRLRGGRTLPPIRLDGPRSGVAAKQFGSRAAALAHLVDQRRTASHTHTGSISLPEDVDPSELVGLSIQRRLTGTTIELDPAKSPFGVFSELVKSPLFGSGLLSIPEVADLVGGVRLSARELEDLLDGPVLRGLTVSVGVTPRDVSGAPLGRPLAQSGTPVALAEAEPVLHYRDILRIERTLQHVVRNTLTYSKAVWASMTPEERAVLLEGFTIGLPQAGLDPDDFDDPSQHVPLLNCVANQVLGFYGNAMIMPFSIPASLAVALAGSDDQEGEEDERERQPLTTGRVQDALAAFHRTAFSPPVAEVTLPTRGVLGEAVLGSCPSAEKIDLTRFWNWQDSPLDEPLQIEGVSLRGGAGAGTLTAPATLAGLPSIINNVGAGDGQALGALARSLAEAGSAQKPFDTAFLGQAVLQALGGKTIDSAEAARKDALASATGLATKAMETAPKVFELAKADREAKAKAADDAKEKAKTDEKAAKKETADKQAAATKQLKENAASFLAATAVLPDQAAMTDFATKVLTSLAGGPLPPEAAASLFAPFDKKTGSNRAPESTAWLTALGLLG